MEPAVLELAFDLDTQRVMAADSLAEQFARADQDVAMLRTEPFGQAALAASRPTEDHEMCRQRRRVQRSPSSPWRCYGRGCSPVSTTGQGRWARPRRFRPNRFGVGRGRVNTSGAIAYAQQWPDVREPVARAAVRENVAMFPGPVFTAEASPPRGGNAPTR